jgi:ubiquinone/menaquinone biosynthesis C-methylase UbiE
MATDSEALLNYLQNLYQEQLASDPTPYIQAHALTRGGVLRQVQAAQLYLPHVTGRVLDWGCYHAPDSCLVRHCRGSEVELYGCDVFEADLPWFAHFHRAARLCYSQVEHPYHLPYSDNFFDTIIAGGVLEHVPNDRESLKELYRILKPDGLLIISCLPNAYSYLEMIARLLGLPYHLRAYTMRQVRSMLLHSGFQPIYNRFMQMTPTLSGVGIISKSWWLKKIAALLWTFNTPLECLWPINRLSSNLFLMARKRTVIRWDKESCAPFQPRVKAA